MTLKNCDLYPFTLINHPKKYQEINRLFHLLVGLLLAAPMWSQVGINNQAVL